MSVFDQLPADVQRLIFSYHSDKYLNFLCANGAFNAVINSEDFQKVIFVKKYGSLIEMKVATFHRCLFDEVKDGNLVLVKFMVRKIEDINISDSTYHTLLYYAIIENHMEVANFLVSCGATLPEYEVHNCLFIAISQLDRVMMDFLITRGAKVSNVITQNGRYLITHAVDCDNLPLLNFLLECGGYAFDSYIPYLVRKAVLEIKVDILGVLLTKTKIVADDETLGCILSCIEHTRKYRNVLNLLMDNIDEGTLVQLTEIASCRGNKSLMKFVDHRRAMIPT